MHEVLHAIFANTGLADHPKLEEFEEYLAHSLSNSMIDVMWDNPDLVKYLMGPSGVPRAATD